MLTPYTDHFIWQSEVKPLMPVSVTFNFLIVLQSKRDADLFPGLLSSISLGSTLTEQVAVYGSMNWFRIDSASHLWMW